MSASPDADSLEEADGGQRGRFLFFGGGGDSVGRRSVHGHEFWKQDCIGGSNCYPSGMDYECLIPTADGVEASSCEEHTDCAEAD